MNAAGSDGTASSGQVPEFKDRRIRSMGRWVANFTNQLDNLLPAYFQQILLQSQIASSLSQYADAMTANNDYNQTCIMEHKKKYTELKLQAIADFRTCSKAQGQTISSTYTADSQAIVQKLADLDKIFVYIFSRCDLTSTMWYLNSFIRTLREMCLIAIESTMNRESRSVRENDLMDLYRKYLLLVINSGKQVGSCVAKSSAASVRTIDSNVDAVAKCVNQ